MNLSDMYGYKRAKNMLLPSDLAQRMFMMLNYHFYLQEFVATLPEHHKETLDDFMNFVFTKNENEARRFNYCRKKSKRMLPDENNET